MVAMTAVVRGWSIAIVVIFVESLRMLNRMMLVDVVNVWSKGMVMKVGGEERNGGQLTVRCQKTERNLQNGYKLSKPRWPEANLYPWASSHQRSRRGDTPLFISSFWSQVWWRWHHIPASAGQPTNHDASAEM
jgi:hypothetical protein